ncbi:MAG TPA: aminotransferase class IV, partial [Bacteroidales bacterium]|nr:aminotransferase class IV [Bacteroidales bacterium]
SGITRKHTINAAMKCGIRVEERAVHEKELLQVSESFITNTSAEITPVIAFGSIPAGNGKPGPLTGQIHKKFREIVESYARR